VTPYADPAALIDDPQVLRVAITDTGEPRIDVRTITGLAIGRPVRAEIQRPGRTRTALGQPVLTAGA
jgi:hypothetical protein